MSKFSLIADDCDEPARLPRDNIGEGGLEVERGGCHRGRMVRDLKRKKDSGVLEITRRALPEVAAPGQIKRLKDCVNLLGIWRSELRAPRWVWQRNPIMSVR